MLQKAHRPVPVVVVFSFRTVIWNVIVIRRVSCTEDFLDGSRCLHWTLTINIKTSSPNENAPWPCYFNVIFPAVVSQVSANGVFTPRLVSASDCSPTIAELCTEVFCHSQQLKATLSVRKSQLPSKHCPRQFPLSFLHLNQDAQRSQLTFGIKALWQPVLPKNDIHPFPVSADKQAAFLRPWLAGYSQGLKKKLQDVWPSSKCRGFSEIWFTNRSQDQAPLALP